MLSLRDTSTNWTRTTRFLVFEAPLNDQQKSQSAKNENIFTVQKLVPSILTSNH